jgi:hypothetical protein
VGCREVDLHLATGFSYWDGRSGCTVPEIGSQRGGYCTHQVGIGVHVGEDDMADTVLFDMMHA